jgi:hypothetical protein
MLKSIKISVLTIFLLIAVAGLNAALAAPPKQAEQKLFPYSADGETYGFVDNAGDWVIEPQYDFAGHFIDGLAVIEQAGQYGFIDPTGAIVIEPEYDFAADFAFGLAAVVVDGEAGFIDPTGQMVIEPQFTDARSFTAEGLAVVRPDETYGYIDQDGQFVIEPQFDHAASFSEGLAAIMSDGRYGFIDESGQVVIEPQFDFASGFSEDLAAVLVNGQVGFVDPDGQLVIEPMYDFAQDFSEGLAVVSLNGQAGFIDTTGQMVIEPQYDFAESFSEGLAAVRVDELIGYIDPTGEMVIEPRFDDAGAFENGLARVERAHRWGYINPDGTPAFLLPVSASSPESTLLISFLPGVPAESREGLCLTQSAAVPAPFAWRCIFAGDEPDEVSTFDPCLLADDGQTIVCGADPLVGAPGFQVELLEELPVQPAPANAGSDSAAWLVQLADGAVCRYLSAISFNIDGERANYTCSDGSVLIGNLQTGTVWQASQVALGDVNRADAGYTTDADTVHQAEIAAVWQPADPAATLAEIGLSADQLSIDTSSVAETVQARIRPAVPYDPDVSTRLDGEPAHLRFSFDNQTLPNLGGVSPHQPQLLIYPVDAYQQIYADAGSDEVSQRIEALQALLQERPETIDGEIPVLPGFGDAEQMLKARVNYLDFNGGSGVRFITHYGIDTTPITEHGVFYTFQGLTDDGQYYIAYYHPAPTTLLPNDFELLEDLLEDYNAFEENFGAYLQEITEQLDAAGSADFSPDLADIDAMLESLQIQP